MNTIQNVFLVLALLVGYQNIGSPTPINTEIYQSIEQRPEIQEDLQIEVKQNTKEKELDKLIDRLASCESSQIPDLIILDSNNEYSYGWLMFQKKTFDGFGERYKLPHNDIMSPEQQIPIAKEMIKNGLWKHWRICGERIGLDKLKL